MFYYKLQASKNPHKKNLMNQKIHKVCHCRYLALAQGSPFLFYFTDKFIATEYNENSK